MISVLQESMRHFTSSKEKERGELFVLFDRSVLAALLFDGVDGMTKAQKQKAQNNER